jgi:hypothetical protein
MSARKLIDEYYDYHYNNQEGFSSLNIAAQNYCSRNYSKEGNLICSVDGSETRSVLCGRIVDEVNKIVQTKDSWEYPI